MSRFAGDDYDEDFPNQGLLWWANVERHMKGPKGQTALRELRDVLRAMPEKKLISGRLADEQGQVCTVGAYVLAKRCEKGEAREDVIRDLAARIVEDDYDSGDITASAGVAVGLKYGLAWVLGDLNDEAYWKATPEERYERVLEWLDRKIEQPRDAVSRSAAA